MSEFKKEALARANELGGLLVDYRKGRREALESLEACARQVLTRISGQPEITIRAVAVVSGRREDAPNLTRGLIRALRRLAGDRPPASDKYPFV